MDGRLAAWLLPGGPVGLPFRWAATSNVEVGQTTYPVNRGRVVMEGEKRERDKVTKGGEERREWNRGGAQGLLPEDRGMYLDICVGVPKLGHC